MNRNLRLSDKLPLVMFLITMLAVPADGDVAKLYEPSVPPNSWLISTMSVDSISELFKINVTAVFAASAAVSVAIIPVGRLSVTGFVFAPGT